jgi:hypothetical protein
METEEITIKIPKPLAEFVKALCTFTKTTHEKFWTQELEDIVEQIRDESSMTPWISSASETYGLDKYFKEKAESSSVQEQEKVNVQCGNSDCNEIYKVPEASFNAVKCPKCGSTEYSAHVPVN